MKRLFAIAVLLFGYGLACAQTTITDVYVSASTQTTATIVWTTSTPSTSQIKYGIDSTLPFANNIDSTLVTSHQMTLTLLSASYLYYFAVVSVDGSGSSAQSSNYNFALCGTPMTPITGTVNNYYQYGAYTLTWIPPTGAVASPTVCGSSVQTTVSGNLSGAGSFSASIADSYKVTPGPGLWHIAVTDAGNLSPISVVFPVSNQSSDVSALLQSAAATAGLTAVIANTIAETVFPNFICTTENELCGGISGNLTPGFIPEASGSNALIDSSINDGVTHVGQLTINEATRVQNFPLIVGLDPTPFSGGAANVFPNNTLGITWQGGLGIGNANADLGGEDEDFFISANLTPAGAVVNPNYGSSQIDFHEPDTSDPAFIEFGTSSTFGTTPTLDFEMQNSDNQSFSPFLVQPTTAGDVTSAEISAAQSNASTDILDVDDFTGDTIYFSIAGQGAANPGAASLMTGSTVNNSLICTPANDLCGGGGGGSFLPLTFTSNQTVVAGIFTLDITGSPTSSTFLSSNNYTPLYPGFDLGTSGTSAEESSLNKQSFEEMTAATQGIMQQDSKIADFYGGGDKAGIYAYWDYFGGMWRGSDEGIDGIAIQPHQVCYFTGTLATGGTTGSSLVTTTGFACHGYNVEALDGQFAQGGILLDTTQGGATGTIASYSNSAPLNTAYLTLGTGTVTPSTAWGNIVVSSCTGNGNGLSVVTTTCNVTLGTSPASPGNFTTGHAYLSGPFQEEVDITVAGTPSAGVQSITFTTGYAWDNAHGNTNAAVMMQGGPGGQAFVWNPSGSWPMAYWVVGALTTTEVVYSNCRGGFCNSPGSNIPGLATVLVSNAITMTVSGTTVTATWTNGGDPYPLAIGSNVVISTCTNTDLNGTFPVTANSFDVNNPSVSWTNGSATPGGAGCVISTPSPTITFHPAAFITGDDGGVSGHANLALNAVPFTTGDALLGAPTTEFQMVGYRDVQGQATPNDGSSASRGIEVVDQGPSPMEYAYAATNAQIDTNDPATYMFYSLGSYLTYFYLNERPANNGTIIFVQGNEPVSSNAKAYNIFEDEGTVGNSGKFGFDPLNGDFTFSQPVLMPSGTTVGGHLPCLQNGTDCPSAGTVTNVSVATANGVSGTVATATTTPAITLTLGAINPTSIGQTNPEPGSFTTLTVASCAGCTGVTNAITSATGGSGTGTVTCLTAACTNLRGTYSVAGGTFTTGTFLTLVWPTTITAYACTVVQNGGGSGTPTIFEFGHSVATATGMTISTAVTIAATTVTLDYSCQP